MVYTINRKFVLLIFVSTKYFKLSLTNSCLRLYFLRINEVRKLFFEQVYL